MTNGVLEKYPTDVYEEKPQIFDIEMYVIVQNTTKKKKKTTWKTYLLGLCSFIMSDAISVMYSSQSIGGIAWVLTKGYLIQKIK